MQNMNDHNPSKRKKMIGRSIPKQYGLEQHMDMETINLLGKVTIQLLDFR